MTAIVADGAALHGAANAELVARLERLPVTPRLLLIRVIVGIATFFDGYTVLAIAFAMPSLVSEWKLTPTEVGLILSAGYVGQLFGAVIFGSLAERYGRLKILFITIVLFVSMDVACLFAWSGVSMIVFRFLQGVGHGVREPGREGLVLSSGNGSVKIRVEGATKVYETKTGVVHALEDVSVGVHDGELVCVLGPSGCGKTTLLRLVAGFNRPKSGTVRIAGRIVASPTVVVPPEKRSLSIVFQSYAVWPHKTVFENLAYGLRLRRMTCLTKKEAHHDRSRTACNPKHATLLKVQVQVWHDPKTGPYMICEDWA
jgi:hypothetical protein